jgi:excisionase family DNA binding protein
MQPIPVVERRASVGVKRWLTVDQLRTILPLKKSRVYYLVHTNQIPHIHLGRTLLFDYDEIVAWVEGTRYGQ